MAPPFAEYCVNGPFRSYGLGALVMNTCGPAPRKAPQTFCGSCAGVALGMPGKLAFTSGSPASSTTADTDVNPAPLKMAEARREPPVGGSLHFAGSSGNRAGDQHVGAERLDVGRERERQRLRADLLVHVV